MLGQEEERSTQTSEWGEFDSHVTQELSGSSSPLTAEVD